MVYKRTGFVNANGLLPEIFLMEDYTKKPGQYVRLRMVDKTSKDHFKGGER